MNRLLKKSNLIMISILVLFAISPFVNCTRDVNSLLKLNNADIKKIDLIVWDEKSCKYQLKSTINSKDSIKMLINDIIIYKKEIRKFLPFYKIIINDSIWIGISGDCQWVKINRKTYRIDPSLNKYFDANKK